MTLTARGPSGASATSPRHSTWAAVLGVALALAAMVVLLFAPLGMSVATSTDSGGSLGIEEGRRSLLEQEGTSVVVVAGLPVLVAAAGAAVAHARRSRVPLLVSAGLLWAFVILGLLSVGLFYLPAAAALTVAALPEARHRR